MGIFPNDLMTGSIFLNDTAIGDRGTQGKPQIKLYLFICQKGKCDKKQDLVSPQEC